MLKSGGSKSHHKKETRILVFEATDRETEGTIVEVGVGCCADEGQETSINATDRATPIAAVSALTEEQTIVAITVTSRR